MMNDRYVSYVSYLKVSRMKYARVFFLRIFIYIRVYKLDPIETRFIYTECELKIRFQTGYLSLLSHFLPLWYEYTIFNVFGRRKNKREREKGKGGSMENLNWIQPICLLSVRDRSHVPKINRNVLLERSNPSWRILSSQGHQPSAKVCTTVHGYGNPISDTGQKRLRMSRVAKIYRLIDVPGHAVSPNVTSPPPWNHDTRFYAPVNPARELSTLSLLSFSFFFLLFFLHFSSIRGGGGSSSVQSLENRNRSWCT